MVIFYQVTVRSFLNKVKNGVTMKNKRRSVNKKLISAVIAYSGMTLEHIGSMCDPPVSKSALSLYFNGKGGYGRGERLARQVSEILGLSVSVFLLEASAFHFREPFHVLVVISR